MDPQPHPAPIEDLPICGTRFHLQPLTPAHPVSSHCSPQETVSPQSTHPLVPWVRQRDRRPTRGLSHRFPRTRPEPTQCHTVPCSSRLMPPPPDLPPPVFVELYLRTRCWARTATAARCHSCHELHTIQTRAVRGLLHYCMA